MEGRAVSDFLSKADLKILQKGLDLYESEPIHKGMMGSMITAMLSAGKRSPEQAKEDCEADIRKAEVEADARKLAVARLRVKLLEMAERPSEFVQ